MGKGFINLAWENFQTNIPQAFQKVRSSEDFCDVTLVCDDEGLVEAHRVILASGSQFFQKLLSTGRLGPNPHPLLYLRGVSGVQLEAVLDFLYRGEARLREGELKAFLELAQQLGISGLMEDPHWLDKHQSTNDRNIKSNFIESENIESPSCNGDFVQGPYKNYYEIPEEKFYKLARKEKEIENGNIFDSLSVKSENDDDTNISGMMNTKKPFHLSHSTKVMEGFKCSYCQKVMKTKQHILKHILRRHEQEPQVKLHSMVGYKPEVNNEVGKQSNLIRDKTEKTQIENPMRETYSKEAITEALIDNIFKNQENTTEKDGPQDPLTNNIAEDMIANSEGTFTCKVCDFVTNDTLDIYIHVEIHIEAMKKKNKAKDQSKNKGKEEIKSEVKRRKSSPLWNFATKGSGFATCNFCNKKVATTSGNTTGAMSHIKSKHSEEIEKYNIMAQNQMIKPS